MTIQFADLPERSSLNRQWRRVVAPKGCGALQLLILGQKFTGVWTHYLDEDKRTVPCAGDTCGWCETKLLKRWKGFIACLLVPTWEPCVGEFTEGAAREVSTSTQAQQGLRGWMVTLKRHKTYRNAPVHVSFGDRQNLAKLPDEFDPLPHLQRLWFGERKEPANRRAEVNKILASIFRKPPAEEEEIPTHETDPPA